MRKFSHAQVAFEAQAALAFRNHELVNQLNHAQSEVERLRNELEMRPLHCEFEDAKNRADKAEEALAILEASTILKRKKRKKNA